MTPETRNQKPDCPASGIRHPASGVRGYTLVELVVAVGLFALIMMLASGAYFVMIGINRQVQAMATGINNLSFALETMTRTIRTGTSYGCPSQGIDCSGGFDFSVKNSSGVTTSYTLLGTTIMQAQSGISVPLTDPSVNVASLKFYAYGTEPFSVNNNRQQARVTIIASGYVSFGPDKKEYFTVQTGATMRGSDI
jgi:prepilin-type N-terminal cleavage/methylation domain-containing protein